MAIKTVLTENNIGSTLETTSQLNKFNAVIQGVSTDVGNVLANGVDGKPVLTSAVVKANETLTTFVIDNVLKTLTYTNEVGTATVFNYTALALDVNVSSITDNADGTYSFVQDDGGPTVILNLSAMLKIVATANTATVTLTGSGTAVSPLSAAAKISTTPGNILTTDANGLFVPNTASSPVFAATSTNSSVTITPAGTDGHTPNFAVNALVVLPTELV